MEFLTNILTNILMNNFGLNILQKPNPIEHPGPQGNPNSLMQQIYRPEMGHRPEMRQRPDMVQHTIRGIPCCIPCYPSSKNPKGLHSKHCAAGKEGFPIEVLLSIVSNNTLQNVQNIQNVQNVQNFQNNV